MEPKIIFEDEELLVLDKPAGWWSTGSSRCPILVNLIVSVDVIKQDSAVGFFVDHSDITGNRESAVILFAAQKPMLS